MGPRVAILAAAVLFGTTGTAQALAGSGSPLGVGALRIAVGGSILAVVAAATRSLGPLRAQAPLVLVAGAGVAVYQVAFFAALADTGVTIGTVVAIGAAPVLTGLLEWLSTAELPGRRWFAATPLAVAGVVLLGSGGGGAGSATGVGLALLASLGYATYAVLGRRMLAGGASPLGVMGASFGIGAVVLAPVAATAGAVVLARPSGVLLVLYLGLLPTAFAYVLFGRALRALPASETATLGLAEPVTATLLGIVALGEHPGPLALAGAGLVLVALAVLIVPVRRRLRPAVAA